MTRTKRIYNNPRLKKTQRYNLHDSGYDENGVKINQVGIPFTWRSFICMGHCPHHRNNSQDQRLIRKKRKAQFRFELKSEQNISEKEECCHLPDNIDYDATICQYCLDCD